MILIASVAAVIFLLDQITKWLVVRFLPLHQEIPVASFFSLAHVRNTGAAFGILPNNNVFFIGLTLTILLVLAFLHRRLAAQGRWSAWGIAFLWGGALGNLADRVFHGSVTDFLAFFWRQWHWPTFNVADSAICIGISLLFLESFRCSPSEKTADPPPFIGTL